MNSNYEEKMVWNGWLLDYAKEDIIVFNIKYYVTGLISMILCLLSLALGLATYNSRKLKNIVRPVTLKFVHNLVGILGYIIGIVSLCYAYYTRWWVFYTEEKSRMAAVIVTVITTLWTLNGSISSGFNQLKSVINKWSIRIKILLSDFFLQTLLEVKIPRENDILYIGVNFLRKSKFQLLVFQYFWVNLGFSITKNIFLTTGSSVCKVLLTGYLKNFMS